MVNERERQPSGAGLDTPRERANGAPNLHEPGHKWTTYRQADGELIFDEYAFVTETEFFDESDEPTNVIVEHWVLESSELATFGPQLADDVEDDEP